MEAWGLNNQYAWCLNEMLPPLQQHYLDRDIAAWQLLQVAERKLAEQKVFLLDGDNSNTVHRRYAKQSIDGSLQILSILLRRAVVEVTEQYQDVEVTSQTRPSSVGSNRGKAKEKMKSGVLDDIDVQMSPKLGSRQLEEVDSTIQLGPLLPQMGTMGGDEDSYDGHDMGGQETPDGSAGWGVWALGSCGTAEGCGPRHSESDPGEEGEVPRADFLHAR